MVKVSKNILWFSDVNKDSIPLVGGKGANLGEMYNLKLPVPPGFIVSASAFKRFIEETGIGKEIFSKLKDLDVESTDKLQAIAKEVQTIIIKTPMPKDIQHDLFEAYETMTTEQEPPFVAVRSSATAEDLPSISANEHVLVKVNGEPRFGTIEEIYNEIGDGRHCNLEVPAMLNNKVQWLGVEQLYRHPAKAEKLYKVITDGLNI